MLNHDGLWVYTEAKLLTSNKLGQVRLVTGEYSY